MNDPNQPLLQRDPPDPADLKPLIVGVAKIILAGLMFYAVALICLEIFWRY